MTIAKAIEEGMSLVVLGHGDKPDFYLVCREPSRKGNQFEVHSRRLEQQELETHREHYSGTGKKARWSPVPLCCPSAEKALQLLEVLLDGKGVRLGAGEAVP